MKWNQYTTRDEVKIYNMEEMDEDNLYYIDTECLILLQGNGVYIGELVIIALNEVTGTELESSWT